MTRSSRQYSDDSRRARRMSGTPWRPSSPLATRSPGFSSSSCACARSCRNGKATWRASPGGRAAPRDLERLSIDLQLEKTQVKQKILVVDDDAAILEVWRCALTAMGSTWRHRRSRKASRRSNRRASTLALLDLRIVPTDGMRLMEVLHQRQPRLPVVIMTAHARSDRGRGGATRRVRLHHQAFVNDEPPAKIAGRSRRAAGRGIASAC